jgi:pimeloyl-ACP methyl ester carboxylesterase
VTAETISGVLAPYRAQFNPAFADSNADEEAAAALTAPDIPTLYLHGESDGALGAEILGDTARHLPAPGSRHLLMPNVGHFLHLEQPGRVWETIQDWLTR